MSKDLVDSVVQCQFYDDTAGEETIRQILSKENLVGIELAVWLIQNGNISGQFLLDVLRDPQPQRFMPVEKTAIFRMREAAAFRLMALISHGADYVGECKEATIDFLGEAPVKDCKELTDFIGYCLGIANVDSNMPELRLNPIAVTKAAVINRKFELLIRYAERKPVWAAIPFLWKTATTYADGRRSVNLSMAIHDQHEIHAISTLQALYAQTPQAIQSGLGNMLSWPATPAVDARLVEWFHGPYLKSEA